MNDQPSPSIRRLATEALGVAVTAWAWTAAMLRVWKMPMRLPWDTRSDATLISAMVKNMTEGGWFTDQSRLGAPFGQNLDDFPHGGETFQLLAMKALTFVFGDWGLAMNLYFLLGAGVLAAVTHLVLRHLRFSALPSAVGALLYTALPFRFVHGEMHLWRSTYYSVPLAALLLIWAATWRSRFLVDPSDDAARLWRRGDLRWPRVLAAVAVAVIVAGTETMSTSFTMTLLAVGAVAGAIRYRDPQRLLVAAAMVTVILSTFAVLSLPTLMHYRQNGTNEVAARRLTVESEYYGLKLTRLVLPEPGHRSSTLSALGRRAQAKSSLPSEAGQALGILGTVGLASIFYGALTRRRGGEPTPSSPSHDRSALRDAAVTNTLVGIGFGTIAGFSVLLAMLGFSQVRVWNRIVLFIAFFVVVELLSRAEQILGWLRSSGRARLESRALLACIAVAVVGFGLWDGVVPPRRSYEAIERRHDNDRSFVASIEAVLPEGAAVFQLPVLDFPEVAPPGRMLDYDPLRAYLADNAKLRWSYGAIKGRPDADWQSRLRDQVGPVGALPALVGLGFEGLWIDTYGFEPAAQGRHAVDGPDQAEIAQLQEVLGVDPLVSSDQRFLFYDLRPYAASLDMSESELAAEAVRLLGVEPPLRD